MAENTCAKRGRKAKDFTGTRLVTGRVSEEAWDKATVKAFNDGRITKASDIVAAAVNAYVNG